MIFDNKNINIGLLVPSERFYIPKMDADMGMISRSIIFMLYFLSLQKIKYCFLSDPKYIFFMNNSIIVISIYFLL